MKKTLIAVIIIIILVVGGMLLSKNKGEVTTEIPTPTSTTETPTSSAPQHQTVVITYTDSGYAPKEITIKTGDTVTFKNMSSKTMWPASAMHPTHNAYGEHTGKCALIGGSDFDSCGPIAVGASWSFTFDVLGSWGYHDHLTPQSFGKIIVE